MSCIVWGCSNNGLATADPSVQYYVLPKHPVIAQQWIEASGWPPDQEDFAAARICSLHFSEDCYTTEVKVIDYMTCYSKVLKYDAIPTMYLPITQQVVIKGSDPHEELREMIVFAAAQNEGNAVVQEHSECKKEYVELQVQNERRTLSGVDVEKYKHVQTKEQLATLESSNKALREQVTRLEGELKKLKENLSQLTEIYRTKDLELNNLHEEYLKSKRSYLSLNRQKMLLGKVFSESQIKILSGKKKIYWSNDDMAVGYTIRHLSNKRCYMYLTKKLNIPLPAVSSIKRWMTLKTSEAKNLTDAGPKKGNTQNELNSD